jgi:hypothetical protein
MVNKLVMLLSNIKQPFSPRDTITNLMFGNLGAWIRKQHVLMTLLSKAIDIDHVQRI